MSSGGWLGLETRLVLELERFVLEFPPTFRFGSLTFISKMSPQLKQVSFPLGLKPELGNCFPGVFLLGALE